MSRQGASEPGTGAVVLVEGESDAVVVRTLLERRLVPAEVVSMGGVTNLARHLEGLGGPGPDVFALVDAAEVRFATGALRRHGILAASTEQLARHRVFVCDRDLEDVLIRALGPDVVREELAEMAELSGFTTFAQMPQWRGRPVTDQLHRFAGSGSGRKLRLAGCLVHRLDPARLPAPLDSLVDAAAARTR